MEGTMNSSRTRKYIGRCTVFMVFLGILMGSLPLLAQNEEFTGIVVSSSRNTITVRDTNGRYQLFTFDRNLQRPATLAGGSQVRVSSSASDEGDVRIARDITVLQAGTGSATTTPNNVPGEVRQIERDIE